MLPPDRTPWITTSVLPAGWPQAVAATVLTIALCAVGYVASEITRLPLELVTVALAGGCALALVAFLNEKLWVRLTLVLHLAMLAGNDVMQGLGAGEIIYMLAVLGGTALWFLKELTVHRRTIAVSGFDVLLLSFFVLMTVTTVVASTVNEADPVQFIKEWGLIAEMLFYFPLRSAIRTDHEVRVLMVFLVVVMVGNGIKVITTYRERLAEAVFAWQIRVTRTNINESVSAAFVILSALVLAYTRRWWLWLLSIGGIAFGSVCLVLSFARGPIVSCYAGLVVGCFLLPFRRSMRIAVALLLSLVIGGAVFYIALPQFANSVASGVTNRLSSLGAVRQDLSLYARVVESETLLNKYIAKSPLIGYGLGTMFDFITPIGNRSLRTTFVHNGIIWALYRFGVPGTLMLYAVILAPLVMALVRLPDKSSTFLRPIVAGVVAINVTELIMNMTSNIFNTPGLLHLAVGWALLHYVWQQVERTQIDGGNVG